MSQKDQNQMERRKSYVKGGDSMKKWLPLVFQLAMVVIDNWPSKRR